MPDPVICVAAQHRPIPEMVHDSPLRLLFLWSAKIGARFGDKQDPDQPKRRARVPHPKILTLGAGRRAHPLDFIKQTRFKRPPDRLTRFRPTAI
jgi:hypothetical protein